MFKTRYKKYMNSSQWQAKRRQALERTNNTCEECGIRRNSGLHVHHLSYANLGHEDPLDLQVLCEPCHILRHDHMRSGKYAWQGHRYQVRRRASKWEVLDQGTIVTWLPTEQLAINFARGADANGKAKQKPVRRVRPRRQRPKPTKGCRVFRVDPRILQEQGTQAAIYAAGLNRES